jgi:hypothetical protein
MSLSYTTPPHRRRGALHQPRAQQRREPLGAMRHLFKFRNYAQLAAQFAASISHVALIGPN